MVRVPDLKEVAGFQFQVPLEFSLCRPWFNSSVMFVNSQMVCLLPDGIFKPIVFNVNEYMEDHIFELRRKR